MGYRREKEKGTELERTEERAGELLQGQRVSGFQICRLPGTRGCELQDMKLEVGVDPGHEL